MQVKAPEHTGDAHHRVCEVCDQRYDTTNQNQVLHHTLEPHRQLLTTPADNVDGERFKRCIVCGQDYDSHDFSAHSHHTALPHAPL